MMCERFAWRLLPALRLPVLRWGPERKAARGFVYLRDIAPSIVQDMRYATANNFTGKPVPGYGAAECVLQRNAAEALKRAQEIAESLRFSLKVYDCYRPVRAVTRSSPGPPPRRMGARSAIIRALTNRSSSRRTFVPIAAFDRICRRFDARSSVRRTGSEARGCARLHRARTGRGGASPGMGTAFDCFDTKAITASPQVTPAQRRHRELLLSIVEGAGFKNYAAEWWHFSLPRRRHARYDFRLSHATPVNAVWKLSILK